MSDTQHRLALAVLILAATVLRSPPALSDTSLIEAVRCTEIAFSMAAESRDIQKFASHLDPDARFVSSAVSRGAAEVAESWSVFFEPDGPRIAWRPQVVEVLESGDLALSRGPYRLQTIGESGETVESWGTFNSIWRKTSLGKWLIVFDAGSPAAKPPDDATRKLLSETNGNCPPQ